MLRRIEACVIKCAFDKLAYGMRLSGGHNKVIGMIELQHAPHCFNVLGSITTVALRLQISYIDLGLQACTNPRNSPGDFSAYKGFSSPRGFVIEKDPIAREKTVALAV